MPQERYPVPEDPVEHEKLLAQMLGIQQDPVKLRQEQEFQEMRKAYATLQEVENATQGIPLLSPDGDHVYLSSDQIRIDTHGRILGVDVEAREQIEELKELVGQLLKAITAR